MDEPDDKTLMRRFQEGESGAFEILFRRHRDAFYRFMCRLAGDGVIAQDVCQHAWLQLIEAAREGRFRSDSGAAFRTWLYTIGRNRWLDQHVRAHGASRTDSLAEHEESVGALPADEFSEPPLALERLEDRARVAAALAGLSAVQREVIAFWLDGYDLREVATLTGTSWHTLVARKKAALARLAKELAP